MGPRVALADVYPGERVWPARHPVRHVILEQPSAERLVVGFSGFPTTPWQPRYHYIGRLKSIDAHRLHVLDDIGSLGSYYLGTGGDDYFTRAVHELIEDTARTLGVDEVWCVGSSKGGFAAVYHALRYGYNAIAGAPQIRLGDYLGRDTHAGGMIGLITGKHQARHEEGIEELNRLLPDLARSTQHRPDLRFFISPRDTRHYEHHLLPFARLLEELGFDFHMEIGDYPNHNAVGEPFSEYLLKTFAPATAGAGFLRRGR